MKVWIWHEAMLSGMPWAMGHTNGDASWYWLPTFKRWRCKDNSLVVDSNRVHSRFITDVLGLRPEEISCTVLIECDIRFVADDNVRWRRTFVEGYRLHYPDTSDLPKTKEEPCKHCGSADILHVETTPPHQRVGGVCVVTLPDEHIVVCRDCGWCFVRKLSDEA